MLLAFTFGKKKRKAENVWGVHIQEVARLAIAKINSNNRVYVI